MESRKARQGLGGGGHFPGVGAKETGCNLAPRLVLQWMGRQNGISSLPFVSSLVSPGIECLYLAECFYTMRRHTNLVTWRYWGHRVV